jgi:hypothetical protein
MCISSFCSEPLVPPLNTKLSPVPEKKAYPQKPRSFKRIARVDLAGEIVVVSQEEISLHTRARDEAENRDPETAVSSSTTLMK